MKLNNTFCLIMAGGKGTRLWPESTENKPKQYLNLVGNSTLLEQTLCRFDGVIDFDNRYIVTTKDQEELALASAKNQINKNGLILEPSGRNTAPCILLSLAYLESKGAHADSTIAIMPSDHVILDTKGFQETFRQATSLCESTDTITTIGIRPHFPHTGYGYIKRGTNIEQINGCSFVSEFKEKPNFETAKEYLASGLYLWNAGMFMAKLKVFKTEFELHSPEMFSFYDKLLNAIKSGDDALVSEIYSQIPKDSIDYAIMEKSNKVTTISAGFDWNDLGSWEALEAVIEKENDNTIVGANSVFTKDSKGNVIFAPNKFVSLINVNDMVVVSNDKAVMIMPKKDAQRVREVVEHLKKLKNTDLL